MYKKISMDYKMPPSLKAVSRRVGSRMRIQEACREMGTTGAKRSDSGDKWPFAKCGLALPLASRPCAQHPRLRDPV